MLKGKQLHLSLSPVAPYAAERFVVHSGVVEAYDQARDRIDRYCKKECDFTFLVFCGEAGVGKSHLLNVIREYAFESGVSMCNVVTYEFDDKRVPDAQVGTFIADYERCRREGGIILVAMKNRHPAKERNPHLRSRLLAGEVFTLRLPTEEELEPLVTALLEKNNLKLSQRNLQYLLKRLPRDPLSFDNIFAKISDLSLAKGKPARLGVIRAAVGETNH